MNINAQVCERRGNWPQTSHSVQSSCLAGKTNFSPFFFFFFVRNRRHSTIGWIVFLVEVKSVSAWKIHDPEKVIFNEYLWAMSFLIRALQVLWSLPLRLACDFYQKPLNQNEGNGLDILSSNSFGFFCYASSLHMKQHRSMLFISPLLQHSFPSFYDPSTNMKEHLKDIILFLYFLTLKIFCPLFVKDSDQVVLELQSFFSIGSVSEFYIPSVFTFKM